MTNLRPLLVGALLLVLLLMWQAWQEDYAPPPESGTTTSQTASDNVDGASPTPVGGVDPITDLDRGPDNLDATTADVPELEPPVAGLESTQVAPTTEALPTSEVISVRTDLLRLEINTLGGDIRSADLLAHPVSLSKDNTPYPLLANSPYKVFVAQSGLVSETVAPTHKARWQTASNNYDLSTAKTLEVPLSWSEGGVTVTKTYRFTRGSYAIEVDYEVVNNSGSDWRGQPYYQLQRSRPIDQDSGFSFTNPEQYSFNGAEIYTPDEKLEKVDFDELAEDGYRREAASGWIAFVQHYFFSAWIPRSEGQIVFQGRKINNTQRYFIRALAPALTVAAGATATDSATLYIGPKLQETLPEIAPGLELTVDYGIFTVLAQPLFWILSRIHDVIGNWGWSIIVLVILIKLLFYKLSEAQYRSMARMRKLQPRMKTLKERHKDDREKLNQAMMEMYKKEKVNPLGGCWPMLVQIPVFICLFWVLQESVELRQAPWILWIEDLSAPDPYYILPILNGVAMLGTQWLSPTPMTDPVQKKMMYAMPVIFSVMFAFFQAGLVLYWTVNALVSLVQQLVITKRVESGK